MFQFKKLSTRDARKVVSLLKSGLDLPEDAWPEPDRPSRNEPNVDAQIDLMNALVRLRSKENGIAMQTLASHAELSQVARGHHEGVDVLKGWRRALIGEELLELLAGKLSLRLVNGEVTVERVEA